MSTISTHNFLPDRLHAPDFKQIGATSLIQPEHLQLSNAIRLFRFNILDADLVKIELLFDVTNVDSRHPLDHSAAARLMDDGTRLKTSAELADEIDFYGSYLQVQVQADQISVVLFSLKKYLSQTLPVLLEILTEANFPEHELKIYATNTIQRLNIEAQKVQKVCSNQFFAAIFGPRHRYGYFEKVVDYEALQRERILKAYASCFQSTNCTIIVSGKVTEDDFALIESTFGRSPWGATLSPDLAKNLEIDFAEEVFGSDQEAPPMPLVIEVDGASQSAIKIGKRMIQKNHPDYPGLQILNTVLGGYFGSRLMSNIREDKGYTYGIGSAVGSLQKSGFFYISTEVGVEVTQATLVEIQKEILRLQHDLIPETELALVKNFIRGSFLGSLENAFSYAEKFKSVYFYGLDYTYFSTFFEVLDQVTPKDLQLLAQRYWTYETFFTVIAGKK